MIHINNNQENRFTRHRNAKPILAYEIGFCRDMFKLRMFNEQQGHVQISYFSLTFQNYGKQNKNPRNNV